MAVQPLQRLLRVLPPVVRDEREPPRQPRGPVGGQEAALDPSEPPEQVIDVLLAGFLGQVGHPQGVKFPVLNLL